MSKAKPRARTLETDKHAFMATGELVTSCNASLQSSINPKRMGSVDLQDLRMKDDDPFLKLFLKDHPTFNKNSKKRSTQGSRSSQKSSNTFGGRRSSMIVQSGEMQLGFVQGGPLVSSSNHFSLRASPIFSIQSMNADDDDKRSSDTERMQREQAH